MSQNDLVVADDTGANVRADINAALQALASKQSGASAPGTTYPYMDHADSDDDLWYIRNAADNAFNIFYEFDETNGLFIPRNVKHIELIERTGDPTNAANKGFVYTKDVGGVTELFYMDESGNVIQITAGGLLNESTSIWARDGVLLANNGVDSDHDVDVTFDALTVSSNANADGTLTLIANGSFTAAIDASGSINQLDTGAVANDTLYYVWVLNGASGTGVVFSVQSAYASVTKPAGYDTGGRLVGAVLTDGSANILAFTHQANSNYFRFDDPIQDVADSSTTANTGKTGTLSVPPNSMAHVRVHGLKTSVTGEFSVAVFPVGASDTTANGDEASAIFSTGGSTDRQVGGEAQVPADGSSQVGYMTNVSSTTVTINTLGFWMNLN